MNDVSPIRTAQPINAADRLRLFGDNIASAYQTLKNQGREHWEQTLDYVRLGLGERVEPVADRGTLSRRARARGNATGAGG